jgi:hypothetical protein
MSNGGMSRMSELIIPSNCRVGEDEDKDESAEGDASELLLCNRGVIVRVIINNIINRILHWYLNYVSEFIIDVS